MREKYSVRELRIIWYVSRKVPDEERRKWIKKLCTLLPVSGTNNQLILDAIEKIVLLRGVESGSTPVKNRLRQVCVRDLLFRDKALIPVGRWIRV